MKFNKPLLIDHPFEDWVWKDVPKFRKEQVRKWIFEKEKLNWNQMFNLPKSMKEKLGEKFDLMPMEKVQVQGSRDTTQ